MHPCSCNSTALTDTRFVNFLFLPIKPKFVIPQYRLLVLHYPITRSFVPFILTLVPSPSTPESQSSSPVLALHPSCLGDPSSAPPSLSLSLSETAQFPSAHKGTGYGFPQKVWAPLSQSLGQTSFPNSGKNAARPAAVDLRLSMPKQALRFRQRPRMMLLTVPVRGDQRFRKKPSHRAMARSWEFQGVRCANSSCPDANLSSTGLTMSQATN